MENTEVPSLNRSHEACCGAGSCEKIFVPTKKPALQRVSAILVMQFPSKGPSQLPNNEQNIRGNLLKQEEMNCCSSSSTHFQGTQGSSADRSGKMLNLDLNIIMDTCEDSLSDSVMNQGGHDRIELGGIHKKKTALQLLSRQFSGSGLALGKSILEKNDYKPRLPNLSSCTDKFNDSDVSLDLQLKLPSRPEPRLNLLDTGYGKLDSATDMADLSLSLGSNFTIAACAGLAAVKPEPYERESQKDSSKVEFCSILVKSEPCDGISQDEACKSAGSSKPDPACSMPVKLEPVEEGVLQSELDEHNSVTHHMEVTHDTSTSKVLDLNSQCMVDLNSECGASNIGMLHDGSQMPVSGSMLSDGSKKSGEALNLASEACIPDSSRSYHHDEVPTCSSIPQVANVVVSQPSDNVSVISVGKELKPARKSSEIDEKALDLPLEKSLISAGNESITADVMSKSITQTALQDENNVVESDGKIDASAKVPDKESFDDACDTESYLLVCARETVLDQKDDDNEHEVCEVSSWMVLQTAFEGSVDQSEPRQEHSMGTADLTVPVDVHFRMPLQDDDVKEKQIHNLDKLNNDHGVVGCDGDPCIDQRKVAVNASENLHVSSTIGTAASPLSKNRPIKDAQKAKQSHEKVRKTKLELGKDSARTTENSGKKVNAREPDPVPLKHNFSSKTDSVANDRSKQSRVINLSNDSKRSSYKKMCPDPARKLESHTGRYRYNDRSLMRDRPHSNWHRDENRNERFRRYENGRRDHALQFGQQGSDWRRIRRDGHGPESATEGSRQLRRPAQDEPLKLSHLSYRRWIPEDIEVQVSAGGRIADRHISPSSRRLGRDVPNFLIQGVHEETPMRDCSDGMVDHPPLPHLQSHYGQLENSSIRRERRSLTPNQMRGPLHLPPDSFMPSPTSLEHSPHQWSPHTTPSDILGGHPEVIHHGLPRIIRHDGMQSPRRHPCYPQDMISGVHGSPPSMHRVSEVDSMGHQLLRPSRGFQRNITRFDVNHRETVGEESFEPLCYSQFGEHEADAEFTDSGRYKERHGIVHSFGHHYDDGEGPSVGVDDGPPRSFEYCPKMREARANRGNPRNIRSKLGDTFSRLGDREKQTSSCNYSGNNRWDDVEFNKARQKRRRC